MRKNLAKHTAKKLPLAKRVLALCFALIFVCSCLLPAFANGTGAELETPGTEVVEAAAPGTEPEPMDLYDEPAAMGDEPAAMGDEPAAMDDQVEKPVEGGEPPVADDTPAKEGATKTTTDASGNTVYEYDTSGTTFPDDDAAALPDGDQMQVDAAFSIPTNIYHFWLKKMSSYDLADIADAAKTAEMTVEQYLAMYGTEKGCYHIMTAADGANLKDYQFANPTSNDDPEGNSRTFAGWYYTDDLGDEQKFVFDECLYVSEGTTVEVYAKWTDEENLDGEQKQEETAPEELTAAMEDGISVNATGNLPEGAKSLNVEAVAESDDEKTLSNIENVLGTLSDQYGAWTIYSFDIKILDADGNELQPADGDVTLSIQGLDLMDETRVVHVHNPVSAVATQSAGPRRAAAHRSSTEQLDATAYGDTVEFTTPNFSDFYVVSGDTRESPWYDNLLATVVKVDDEGNPVNNVYAAPGTTIQFQIKNKNATDFEIVAGGSPSITIDKNATIKNFEGKNLTEYKNKYKACVVVISANAQPGDTAIVRTSVTKGIGAFKQTTYYAVKIEVLSERKVIEGALTNKDYPVTIAVLEDSSGMLPNEPGVQNNNYYYFDQYYYLYHNSERVFTNYATNVLSDNGNYFLDHFQTNSNNTNTVGIVDASGIETNKALKANWAGTTYQDLLNKLVQNVAITVKTANGGKTILTKSNVGNYELVPYVVKLQTSTRYNPDDVSQMDRGWHIDMYVRLKNTITLSYVANLPSGKKVNGLTLPSTVQGPSPLTATVDVQHELAARNVQINVDSTVICADGTVLKFKGWNTQADGSGTTYLPDSSITIYEDSILYGMWEELTNDLTITKNVTGMMGDHSKDFNFTVEVKQYAVGDDDSGEWKDVTSDITYDGPVTNGTFTLKHNESIKLKGLSGKYMITLTENLEDAEYKTTATGYPDERTSGREYTYYAQIGSDGAVQLSTTKDGEYNLGNAIVVENNKTIDPDMGVLLDTLPYILILVVVVGGGVLLFLRKRKNDDDE